MTAMKEPCVDFDYGSIDGAHHDHEPDARDLHRAAVAFREVLDWVTDGRGVSYGITTRMHAFIWAILPDAFDGRSQSDVARRLGITPAAFSRQVTRFRSRFGVTLPHIKGDAARLSHSKARQSSCS